MIWCFIFAGANHEGNIKKMKVLTMVSIASEQSEIEFTALAKQLMLNEDDVEDFVIEGRLIGMRSKSKIKSCFIKNINQ